MSGRINTGLFLVRSQRWVRVVIEPSPVGLVALQLARAAIAALDRAKLFATPAPSDQPEGTAAVWIAATILHDTASAFARISAFVRRILQMKFSRPW
jgi:hypothetical protein